MAMDDQDKTSQTYLRLDEDVITAVQQKLSSIGENIRGGYVHEMMCKIPGVAGEVRAEFTFGLHVRRGLSYVQFRCNDSEGVLIEMDAEYIRDARGGFYNVLHRLIHQRDGNARRKGVGSFALRTLEEAIISIQNKHRGIKQAYVFAAASSQPTVLQFFKENGYDFLYDSQRQEYEKLKAEIIAVGGGSPVETASFIRIQVTMQNDTAAKDVAYISKERAQRRHPALTPDSTLDVTVDFRTLKNVIRNPAGVHLILPEWCMQKVVRPVSERSGPL